MDRDGITKLSDRYYMYKGFVLAPLASVLGVLIADVFAHFIMGGAVGLTIYFINVIIILYIASFFVGLPIYFLLKHFGVLNLWSLVLSAALAGYLVSIAAMFITAKSSGLVYVYTVSPAITVAITFWYIYTHRNLNKSLNLIGSKNVPPS